MDFSRKSTLRAGLAPFLRLDGTSLPNARSCLLGKKMDCFPMSTQPSKTAVFSGFLLSWPVPDPSEPSTKKPEEPLHCTAPPESLGRYTLRRRRATMDTYNSRLNPLPQQDLPIFSLIFRLQDELLKDSLHAIGLASF